MPVSVKVTPYEQSFKLLVDKTLSPKAQNDLVAQKIRLIVADADETNRATLGRIPPKNVTVNGRQDSSLSGPALAWQTLNVIPPDSGTVIAEYELANYVLAWIMQTLRDRSPVLSGKYRDGHRLFADDVEVGDPSKPPMADEYTFFNLEPYARKIEIGKTESGRDFVVQVPNRIYERTAKDAAARFGNMVRIRSGFASTSAPYRLKQDQAARSFRGGRKRISARQRPDRVAGSIINVPAIYVTLR